jgi:WD40 repeat protein
MHYFPIALGRFLHHSPLDADVEAEAISSIWRQFGIGDPVAWEIPMLERGADAVERRLQMWSEEAHGSGVLYWVGHGWSDDDRAALAHALSPERVGEAGVSPRQLADKILDWEFQSHLDSFLIVIVDTCQSNRFVQLLSAELDRLGGRRPLLIIGTSGTGSTTLGRFREALGETLENSFKNEEAIELWQLAGELKRRRKEFEIIPKNVIDACLLRATVVPPGLSVTLDVREALVGVMSDLSEDERRHFIPKAQSAELGEVAWYFEGRDSERLVILDWLRNQTQGLLVITGYAGTGKSALLGDLVVRSRRSLAEILQKHKFLDPLPPDQVPPEPFDSVIHMSALTIDEIIDRLVDDLGLRLHKRDLPLSNRIDQLILTLSARTGHVTILADALDESQDVMTVAHLLRRVSRLRNVRVIVGTRASIGEDPDINAPHKNTTDLLDTLTADDISSTDVRTSPGPMVLRLQRDPQAIRRYVKRRLTATFGSLEGSQIKLAAKMISDAGYDFLHARLAVHEIIARPKLLQRSRELHSLVANSHQVLFGAAVARLSHANADYGSLLLALGLARGRGLPILNGVWAAIAGALSGASTNIEDRTIDSLLLEAAPYLVADREGSQTVYRLAHRTFADYFSKDTEETRENHRIIFENCMLQTTEAMAPNPYLRTHTTAHAARAGTIAWQALNDRATIMDKLDPDAVVQDAVGSLLGRHPIPPHVAALIGAVHLIRLSRPEERPALRSWARARQIGFQPISESDLRSTSWALEGAVSLQPMPLHLTISVDLGAVLALAPLLMDRGRAWLVSGSEEGTIQIWDCESGIAIGKPLVGHKSAVSAVAAVPRVSGAPWVVSAGRDATLRVWDIETGRLRKTIEVGTAPDVLVAFAFGEMYVVGTGDDEGRVRLWDLDTGLLAGEFGSHAGWVQALTVIDDGMNSPQLVSGGDDGVLRIWDSLGVAVGELVGDQGWIRSIAVGRTEDGREVLIALGEDGTLRLWDAESQLQIESIKVATGDSCVEAFETESGSLLLASGGDGNKISLWEPRTGELVGELVGHSSDVRAIVALPSQGRPPSVASASSDGTVRVWYPQTIMDDMRHMATRPKSIEVIAVVPRTPRQRGRQTLLFADDSGGIGRWELETDTFKSSNEISNGVLDWRISPTPRSARAILAYLIRNEIEYIFADVDGVRIGSYLADHSSGINTLADWLAEDKTPLVVGGGTDGYLRMWRSTGEYFCGVRAHSGAISALAVLPHPDGLGRLISAGQDGSIIEWRWDVTKRNRNELMGKRLLDNGSPVDAMTVLDGHSGQPIIVYGGENGVVNLASALDGSCNGSIRLGTEARAMAATDDGKLVIACGGGIALLNVNRRRPSAEYSEKFH